MSALSVGVVGANGFMGGEVVRVLSMHPKVKLTMLCAGRSAGKQLSEVRPSLRGPADLPLQPFDADALAGACEVVFLAMPHGASAVAARELLERGCKVIDLGSDFRLEDPEDYPRWYGREADAPELLGEAVYSLPELTGTPDPSARLIANPGCFATALSLGLAPLLSVLRPGAPVQAFGVTGSTGSGIVPKAGTHHSLRVSSFTAYKPLEHQHLGEVGQLMDRLGHGRADIRFVPHSLPAARGIHVTLMASKADLQGDVQAAFHAAYDDKPLVDVVEGPVPMGAVQHSVRTLVGLSGDDDTVLVFVAIDNLLKGGSGQAIQNLNLWQGWDETLGLPVLGSWP